MVLWSGATVSAVADALALSALSPPIASVGVLGGVLVPKWAVSAVAEVRSGLPSTAILLMGDRL